MHDITPSLDPMQFGNRPRYSTVHYLISLYDFLARNTDDAEKAAAILAIDFSKAFDLVSHDIVPKKLLDMQVRPAIMPTVASFLSDRRQVVRLSAADDSGGQPVSSERSITCGTPQGTKIAPIAFLAHINDCATGEQNRWKCVDELSIGICLPENQEQGGISRALQSSSNSLEE